MPVNEYALDLLVRERLSEARVAALRRGLPGGGRPRRPPMRSVVGKWLVRLGTRILAEPVLDAR